RSFQESAPTRSCPSAMPGSSSKRTRKDEVDSATFCLQLESAPRCGLWELGMRRVVVTGLGMVTPLACGVEATWQRLLAGQSGARKIEKFDVADLAAKIACQIPRGDGSDGTYNPDQWMEPKEQRRVDEFIVYAMCAARQALDDSGWKPESREDQIATGVMIGSGIGGVEGIAETSLVLQEKGPRPVSPFFIPGRLINLASGHVSIKAGLKGPNHDVVSALSYGGYARDG